MLKSILRNISENDYRKFRKKYIDIISKMESNHGDTMFKLNLAVMDGHYVDNIDLFMIKEWLVVNVKE